MSSIKSFRKTTTNFYEKQKFNNVLLFSMLIIVEALFIYASMEQLVANKPWGLKPTNTFLIIAATALIPTPVLIGFYLARFETIINEDGIFYRWAPFTKKYKMIDWTSVVEVSIIDVTSAGLTWRFSSKYGEVQYLGGGFGIQIKMKSGRRRIIGTRKPEEINRILIRMAGPKYQPATTKRSLEYD
ncbi:MAG: hypothetical protein KBH11_14050 [Bacteroidia bacterium]|nr:hypothetical protein [Bacteroidota bacterium]MBP9084199.1 hypothetical protein [Bacteroidia bacterium]MBK7387736.1 hypothetical protein [Bacteroidota bacterium]MBK8416311.1 hypothetical protein [Bacteroidota bacterium]MBK8872572.1 hypothetical protein [Bacteroidota bacterium]